MSLAPYADGYGITDRLASIYEQRRAELGLRCLAMWRKGYDTLAIANLLRRESHPSLTEVHVDNALHHARERAGQ